MLLQSLLNRIPQWRRLSSPKCQVVDGMAAVRLAMQWLQSEMQSSVESTVVSAREAEELARNTKSLKRNQSCALDRAGRGHQDHADSEYP